MSGGIVVSRVGTMLTDDSCGRSHKEVDRINDDCIPQTSSSCHRSIPMLLKKRKASSTSSLCSPQTPITLVASSRCMYLRLVSYTFAPQPSSYSSTWPRPHEKGADSYWRLNMPDRVLCTRKDRIIHFIALPEAELPHDHTHPAIQNHRGRHTTSASMLR